MSDETFPKDDAFMLYATFCGDVERTAHALNLSEDEVRRKADAGGWDKKLRGILELKRSSKPGDVERAINRAINFVQAHKLRMFLERLLQRICDTPDEELNYYLMQTTLAKGGSETRMSTRPMADLAAAFEKCHSMTYLALNDSMSERRHREDVGDATTSGGELHAKIAAAMARQGALSDAQDQQATPPK
jgi:hypothetical protein